MWLICGGAGELERSVTGSSDASLHTAVASFGKAAVLNADHTRVDVHSLWDGPQPLATAIAPQWATTLVAMEIIAVVGAVATLFVDRPLLAGRGPPDGFSTACTGQELLTRLCLSRR
ncbi:hypothetical protein A5640_08195 [Mycobacterium asiaticum]|uniref:Uncharacterized protein n=1 Tax=Mycobacterium asiaticum TaxID=1790 RepID=A0A1A3KS16_MYCAS|nr:hypothetical protein A5640_08195 [Mycobacterium asiaticum]